MKKQIIVCAAVLAASVGAAATAHAQYVPIYPRVHARGLPPHQAIVVVRSIGMQPLSRPLRRGANYVVVASTRSGARMRIVIDAFDGTIVRMRPARMARLHRQPYRPLYRPPPVTPYVPAPVEAQPVPPRNIPGPRVANIPGPRVANAPAAVPSMAGVGPHTPGPIPPRHTPLPRPRPKVASKDITGSMPLVSKPPVAAHHPKATPAPETAKPETTKPASPAPSPPPSGELKLVPVAPLE